MDIDHPDFAPHFTHLAAGRLCFPWCEDCRRFHWYPMPRCPHCQGGRLDWRQVGARGTLFSWTEIHHAFDARYNGPLPYIVALVDISDAAGVRLVTHLSSARNDELSIDMPLEADFSRVMARTGQLAFRPLRSEGRERD